MQTKIPSNTPRDKRSSKLAARFRAELIAAAGDWRAKMLAEIRRLIEATDTEIVEERKWAKAGNPLGVPVWSRAGIVCTGETYKEVVKLTFARGASLDDPQGLFNSSLGGNRRRAIDLREGEKIDAKAFQALVRAAVDLNLGNAGSKSKSAPKGSSKANSPSKDRRKSFPTVETDEKQMTRKLRISRSGESVKLLSGGNPQIAKGDGDEPVQAYIAAMPGWKRDIGKRLDAIIERAVPDVVKAVKWNSPLYGVEGHGFFLGVHCFTKYVKVTFFKGTSLQPIPPGGTEKSKEARWIDIHEGAFEERQMSTWVKQAAAIPGWNP